MQCKSIFLSVLFLLCTLILGAQTGMDCDNPPALEIIQQCPSYLTGQVKLTHNDVARIKWIGLDGTESGDAFSDGDFVKDLPFGSYLLTVSFDEPNGCVYPFSLNLSPDLSPQGFWVGHENENQNSVGIPLGDGSLSVFPAYPSSNFFTTHNFEWYSGSDTSFVDTGNSTGGLSEGQFHLKVKSTESGCETWQYDHTISVNEKRVGELTDFNDQMLPDALFDPFNIDVYIPGTIDDSPSLRSVDTVFGLSGFKFLIPEETVAFSMDISNHFIIDAQCRIHLKDSNDVVKQSWTFDFLPGEKTSIQFDFNNPSEDGYYLSVNLYNTVSSMDPLDIEVDNLWSIKDILLPSLPLQIDVNDEWNQLSSFNTRNNAPHFVLCEPDSISLRDAFQIFGGSTPYTLTWDLDGDGNFDDDSGDDVIIYNPPEGINQYGIKVQDASGKTKTLVLELEIQVSRDYNIVFPGFDSINDSLMMIRVCQEDTPLRVESLPMGGQLSGEGMIGDTIFDPMIAGLGSHFLFVKGENDCDLNGFAVVHVLPESDPSWMPFTIAECDQQVDLNQYIEGDVSGRWYIDGNSQNDSFFDPAVYGAGEIELTYALGLEPCNTFETRTIFVDPTPIAQLVAPASPIKNCDPPLALETLLAPTTTLGGTWSGGNYIIGETFDPTGLPDGTYSIIYTVGEGSCERRDTTEATVLDCTTSVTTSNFENFITINPNPGAGIFKIRNSSKTESPIFIGIYDSFGKKIYTVDFTKNIDWQNSDLEIDLTSMTSGMYNLVVNLKDGETILKRLIKL